MDNAPIRALIADDELLARSTLRLLLGGDPDVDVVGESSSGADAIVKIRALAPDLVFLDIQMSNKTGFDVLAEIEPAERPAIIFVTAFDTHALRAFEVQALDYLLKPFDDERFARALDRAKTHIRQRRAHELARQIVAAFGQGPPQAPSAGAAAAPGPAAAPRYLDRIAIKNGPNVSLLPAEQIDWIEAEDYYVQVHAGGEAHLLRESMRKMEAQLSPQRFVRIHRSVIVNIERVRKLRTLSNGEYSVVLKDGTELRLSRSRRDALCAMLGVP